MHWLVEQIAAELDAISATSAQLEKRIERMLRSCPPEIKTQIEATSLGLESGFAKDAALLADLITEKAEAQ
jgi:RNase adaptor protein for sRNA GlmZ degradation